MSGVGAAELFEARVEAREEHWRRLRAEQRHELERAAAHARMADTMYASTPDESVAPHPFPLEFVLKGGPARKAPAQRSAGTREYAIPLFPSASDAHGRQGFARVVNRSAQSGQVEIEAIDDAGVMHGPSSLTLEANEAVHFNSVDLEEGNADKGLSGGVGEGEGAWRLRLSSTLALEVYSYIRTGDGFLTSMHDVVPESAQGHRVAIFNPGRNMNQVSRLRVINPGEAEAEVRIEGTDDAGETPGSAVEFTLEAGASRTLSARELESGEAEGLSGALGTGTGKWRLLVSSEVPLRVLSLLSSPTGHLTNLSSAPRSVEEDAGGEVHEVAYFPAASRWEGEGVQGFARLVNRSGASGEVRIEAIDDAGVSHASVSLTLEGNEAVHFNSQDLEEGNAGKGHSGGIGEGTGDWRLLVSSTLELEVFSYIRTSDGFLTGMHDVAPETPEGHRVVIFNPGRNANQVSRLRLVNAGEEEAEVRIEGTDDAGASPGSAVTFSLPAGAARKLTSKELESGEARGLSGALGTGAGKWRLLVSSEQALRVLSLLSSPTGHITNLSAIPADTESAAEVFAEHISGPVVQSKCINCHVEGGISGHTRLVFVPESTPAHESRNLHVLRDFLNAVDGAADLILNKIQGVGHGGGVQVPPGSPEFAHMQRFLTLLGEDVASVTLTPETLFDTVRMGSWRKTLRRAAIIFAGRIPTDEEYARVAEGGFAELRPTIRDLMTGPQFHEFLIRGANDRLLTDRGEDIIGSLERHAIELANENYRRRAAAHEDGSDQAWQEYNQWLERVIFGADQAPLELIAHVVENDLPYTEILTADYIMANPWAAAAYGASTRFDNPENFHEFKPSRIVSYFRVGEGYESEYDPVVGANRILSPGPLSTDYPHAGVLNTSVFLSRYPTTATNRNRARSRWTYYHFLGLDIEKSASRTTDPEALADTNNPTMHNPACTVCHRVLDPVAGTFQNYFDEGQYKTNFGGIDSLDEFYKEAAGPSLSIRAASWRERETLSWTMASSGGTETLQVMYTNPLYDEATDVQGIVSLDRLRVVDDGGHVVFSQEFEDVDPPIGEWGGTCGEPGQSPGSPRNDHLWLHWGEVQCAIYLDVELPGHGIYRVEIIAWARYPEGGFARLAVSNEAYREGDTWYRDMRPPGFAGENAPNSDNSVQWLAKRIVADERFSEATVKFWWPAILGSEVAEPPADEGDAGFEGLLLAANAQAAEVERLARGFRRGFQGGSPYNLKDLLVEIVLSKWFRADALEGDDPVRRIALQDAGARRLLTPEELGRKTAALTGYSWGRRIRTRCWPTCDPRPTALTDEFRLLYGGIDSDGITERARDITSVMEGVARTHALESSCPVVLRELYLLRDEERRLFAGIDPFVTPTSEFAASFDIRSESPNRKETLTFGGPLSAGPKVVTLTYVNDYADAQGNDRNVYLDRLTVRNAGGGVIASRELESLPRSGDCNQPGGDHYALYCTGSVEVPIEIPRAGDYELEVIAWAEQAGDERPRLNVAVESAIGAGEGAGAIRRKLVELHDKLLGVQVTPYSPDVEAAYGLFVDVWESKRALQANESWTLVSWRCPLNDISYFDGILDDVVVRRENEFGDVWYEFDWDRVDDFLNDAGLADPQAAAQTWVVVLAYLLMDYRYLYL